jgi:hypothetical protein
MASISRRRVLLGAGAVGLVSPFVHAADAQKAGPIESKRRFLQAANDQWKAQHAAAARAAKAAERRGEFASLSPPVQLIPFKDWDYYYCKGRGPDWFPNKGQEKYRRVLVPEGFVTDLTSIPQILWSSGLRPEGSYAYAAIVHDYLYWTQERPKAEADQIFMFAMQDSKVDAALGNAIYAAVSSKLGQSAWDKNAKLKKQGERRILRKFPQDFTVSWNEWKKQPQVFFD